MTFYINIAGIDIQISSQYDFLIKRFQAFLSYGNQPKLSLEISNADLVKEGTINETIVNSVYKEISAIHRKIAESVLDYHIFLMHGSVISVSQEAFMITASSGVGKTTRANTWINSIPDSHILNGDKPLIKIADGQAFACGTPWCGKENQGTNEILPLKAIFFLERSDQNSVTEIPFSEAFIPLLKQTYRPQSADKMKQTLHLLNELNGKVRFFRFCSNLDEEAVKMAYAAATSTESTLQK